jgi:hypothetical protein
VIEELPPDRLVLNDHNDGQKLVTKAFIKE